MDNSIKDLKDKYLSELKDIIDEQGLEWYDEYFNFINFSPNWDEYNSDIIPYFNVILGKYLMLIELYECN